MIQHVLLESPSKLALLVFFWLLTSLMIWRRRRTERTRWIFLGSIPASMALLALQAAITTDVERVRNLIDELVVAVDSQDSTLVTGYVDPDYSSAGRNRAEILKLIEASLRRVQIDQPFLRSLTVETSGDTASVDLRAFARVVIDRQPQGLMSSSWHLELRRRASGWRLSEITPLTINGHPADAMWDMAMH
jgi:hypothetical protein